MEEILMEALTDELADKILEFFALCKKGNPEVTGLTISCNRNSLVLLTFLHQEKQETKLYTDLAK